MEATTLKAIPEKELHDYQKFIAAMTDYARMGAEEVGITNFEALPIAVDCGDNTFLGVVSVDMWGGDKYSSENKMVILAHGNHFQNRGKRNFIKCASPKFGPCAQAWYDILDFYKDIETGKVTLLTDSGKPLGESHEQESKLTAKQDRLRGIVNMHKACIDYVNEADREKVREMANGSRWFTMATRFAQ